MPEEHKNDRLEKWAKIVSLILAAIAMLGVVGFCLTYFLIQIPLFDGSGWITAADGSRQYLNYYKVPLTHWQELDGKRYYFDPETCAMATGWLETEEGTFCLSSTGVYELIPGFIVGFIASVVATLLDKKPSAEVEAIYDAAVAMKD